MEIIGIIPARGNSKRIPRKNIKKFNGNPMISYTIHEAKKSKYLTDLYVTTEDEQIKKISKKFDVKIIDRPKKLSQDKSSSDDVFKHAISYIEENYDSTVNVLVVLQPTSPLRTVNDIDGAIEKFMKNKCDSVSTVSKVEHPPHWMFMIKQKQLERIKIKGQEKILERHQIPDIYQINGAVQVTTRDNIMKNNSETGKIHLPYIMPPERSIDIDTIFEFKIAELILKNRRLFKLLNLE